MTPRITIRSALLVLLLAAAACDGLEPFERTNPADPATDAFRPTAPRGLQVTVNDNVARLQWNDRSAHEEGYLIERAVDDTTSFETVAELGANATTFEDDLTEGQFWAKYRVSAFVHRNEQRQMQAVSETVALGDFSMERPVVEMLTERTIRIQWPDPYDAEDGFVVERAVRHPDSSWSSGFDFEPVATVASDVTEFVDTFSFQNDFWYRYRVRALARNLSGPSTEVQSFAVHVSAPHSLSMEGGATEAEHVVLRWKLHGDSSMVEGQIVERSRDDGPWHELAELGRDVRSFRDQRTDPASVYAYRVRTLASAPSRSLSVEYGTALVWQHEWHSGGRAVQAVTLDEARGIVYIGVGSGYDSRVVGWEWATGREVMTRALDEEVNTIDVFPDGERIMVATGSSSSLRGALDVFEVATGRRLRRLVDQRTFDTALSRDGRRFVSLHDDIEVRDVETGMTLNRFPTVPGGTFAPALHPSEPLLVTGNHDRTVRFYDLERSEPTATVRFDGSVIDLDYSATGDVLLAHLFNRDVRLLHPETAELLAIGQPPDDAVPTAAALGPGRRFVTASYASRSETAAIQMWSYDGSRLVATPVSDDKVVTLDAPSDGDYFVSGGGSVVRIWTFALAWHTVNP